MDPLARKLEPIWRRFRVRFAYLWGSRARGRAGPRSDYDFAVSMPIGPRALDPYLVLADALSLALGTDDVDLTLLERAEIEVQYVVQRSGRVLYEVDPEARRRFEHLARLRYWDERIRLRRHDRALARRIREGTFGA